MGNDEISFEYREQLKNKMEDYYSTLVSLNEDKETNYNLMKAKNKGAYALGGAAMGAAMGGPPGAVIGFLLGLLSSS